MNTIVNKRNLRTLVLAFSVLASGVAAAHGGGGWHGGGWHGGGYHGGGWHGGGWYGGGLVIGAPYYYGGGCQTVRVCNRYGNCWLRQNCY